jgi:hypothetical protein
VHHLTRLIILSNCISTLTQLEFPGAPLIALEFYLQPDGLYVYILIDLEMEYIPSNNVANDLVIVPKMMMIYKMVWVMVPEATLL